MQYRKEIWLHRRKTWNTSHGTNNHLFLLPSGLRRCNWRSLFFCAWNQPSSTVAQPPAQVDKIAGMSLFSSNKTGGTGWGRSLLIVRGL